MRLLTVVSLAGLLMTGVALADDAAPPPKPVTEMWQTSEGNLILERLPFSFQGTYDQDNGRMVGTLSGATYVGYWGEDGSAEECKTAMLGTLHWGRIVFTFDKANKHFDGKWGYCDADPDSGWTGDIGPAK